MPGPDLGEDPRQMTVVTYDTWAAGGPRADVVAATFRRDRLLVGVSIQRYTDPPSAGTPVVSLATPTALASRARAAGHELGRHPRLRITTVLAGQTPAGVDPALADVVLPLDQLVDAATPVFGGYKAGVDLLRCGYCGEENSLLPFADEAGDGFNRGVVLGPLRDGVANTPVRSVAVLELSSPETALAVLEAIRQAPHDLPTSIPVPRGTRTLAVDPDIPLSRRRPGLPGRVQRGRPERASR